MKLGVMTAAFPDQSLEQVADWCAANGFESLEIACWPASGGEKRRYAGVCHIDVEKLDASGARAINEVVSSRGLEISALAYYPNNLHPDATARAEANAHLLRVIDAAATLGVEVVGTFVGNDRTATPRANMHTFAYVFPALIDHARERGVKVAIENCPMIFSEDEWPGGNNLASSPAAWREMFEIVPWEGFGLNFDPSHLVWLMIDCDRAVREFADRIDHVHAKDSEIDRTASTSAASCPRAWAGRYRGCPVSARCGSTASSPRCMPSATTAGSRSSTRIAASRAATSSSSAVS